MKRARNPIRDHFLPRARYSKAVSCGVDEARESFDDPGWKRPGPSGKLIRQYYWRHRPEKYVGWNPIPRESGRRRDVVLDEKERRMKARLEKKGWWVKGPKVD